jgi:hypothetical protein
MDNMYIVLYAILILFYTDSVFGNQWDCKSSSNIGTFDGVQNDQKGTGEMSCTISGNNHVAVVNTLEITGSIKDMNQLFTITAAKNRRHFYLNNANATLTLRYLKLVGGYATSNFGVITNKGGSILIYRNGGELNLYSSIVFNNKAKYGGGIYACGSSTIMNIYNSIIHNNEVPYGRGGGIYYMAALGIIIILR